MIPVYCVYSNDENLDKTGEGYPLQEILTWQRIQNLVVKKKLIEDSYPLACRSLRVTQITTVATANPTSHSTAGKPSLREKILKKNPIKHGIS